MTPSQPNPTEWEQAVRETLLILLPPQIHGVINPQGIRIDTDVNELKRDTALEAIRKATSEAIGEDEDVDSIKDYHDSISARDRNGLRIEQRKAIGIKEEAA